MSVALSQFVANSEWYYLMQGRKIYGSSSVEKAILWHHGAGGEWNLWEPQYGQVNVYRLLEALANAGYTILSCEFGGAQTWGNAANQAKITSAVSYLSTLGCRTDRVGLIGHSMGFMCLARWAAANTGKVAALAGLIPCADPQWTYDNVPSIDAAMNAAYPSGGWAGANATANPTQTAISSALGAAHIPTRCYYATDDPLVGSTTSPTFASTVNAAGGAAAAVAMGTGGHTDVPLGNIDLQSWVRFFQAAF